MLRFAHCVMVPLLALGLAGCGWFSNEVFYEGYGHVTGRLLLEDAPVAGALVFVQDEMGVWDRGSTDENGRFAIAARAGRAQQLVALWGDATGIQRRFELPVDANKDLGNIDLRPFGRVQGTVVLEGLSAVEAELAVDGTDWTARPNPAGIFSLNLPAGTWDLTIRAAGHQDYHLGGLKLDPGEQLELDPIALDPNPDYTCAESRPVVDRYFQVGTGALDILFVIDNSRSMVGEQVALGSALGGLVDQLESGQVDYRLAVITTGMESLGCQACPGGDPSFYSCINETGEGGRFQDRVGHNDGTVDDPLFSFTEDDSCRQIETGNLGCFFDAGAQSGVALIGVQGCGYERGLAAMRAALSAPLKDTWNADFLRPNARLAVVVVSDEDDCGEVGDVTENMPGISGNACYYAARGVAPDGATVDSEGKPYALTPVYDYADFLRGLKPSPAQVTFSAVVGMVDPKDPATTTIEYAGSEPNATVSFACGSSACDACDPLDNTCLMNCQAFPGTRYIALAQATGGGVESICQTDFSLPLAHILGQATGFRSSFALKTLPLDPALIAVRVDGQLNASWTYDPTRNEVVFGSEAAPEQFQPIEIEYTAACP